MPAVRIQYELLPGLDDEVVKKWIFLGLVLTSVGMVAALRHMVPNPSSESGGGPDAAGPSRTFESISELRLPAQSSDKPWHLLDHGELKSKIPNPKSLQRRVGVRQQRHMTRSLDGLGDHPLLARRDRQTLARVNLAVGGHQPANIIGGLVIDVDFAD